MKKNTDSKILKNKEMSPAIYALRRQVIDLIYAANKLHALPRIDVRVAYKSENVAGCARLNDNIIWIVEGFTASKPVIFHEIIHAVFGVGHIESCPLMRAMVDLDLSSEKCDKIFLKYAKKWSRK